LNISVNFFLSNGFENFWHARIRCLFGEKHSLIVGIGGRGGGGFKKLVARNIYRDIVVCVVAMPYTDYRFIVTRGDNGVAEAGC
jgi:hypothetical protein